MTHYTRRLAGGGVGPRQWAIWRFCPNYRKMLSSRSWKGQVWWEKFQQIKERFPLLRPKLHLPYGALQALVATTLWINFWRA